MLTFYEILKINNMIGIFLIGTLLICIGLFFNKTAAINYALVICYTILLWALGFYEYNHLNTIELEFFKPDALGILFIFAMCIISIPAFYHGYRYIATHNETPRSRGIFFAAMVMLMSACSMAYLSNHIAVTWIFAEITTLSASALIYHHRNIRALEGVWKYVFICAISITFIYIGILFLSLAMKQAGIEDMSFDSIMEHYQYVKPVLAQTCFPVYFHRFYGKNGFSTHVHSRYRCQR